MPTISQRISKKTVMRRQTGLGVPGAATGQVMRRTSSIFKATRATYKSNEVVSHHQSTGVGYGLKAADGVLAGELSAGTYQMQMEAMLQKIFVATASVVMGADVTSQAAAPQISDPTNELLAGGVKVGDVGQFTGFTTTAVGNNSRDWWVTAIGATTMTGIFLDGGAAMLPKVETGSVSFAVRGKKALVPTTGHLKSYLQVEEWYSDNSISDLFNDVIVASIDIDLPATGNATFNSTYAGLTRLLTGVQVMAAPTVESSSPIMASLNGFLYVNGVSVPVTSLKISMKNSAAGTGAEIGSNASADVIQDIIEVSGSFASLLRDTIVSSLYNAETVVGIAAVVRADTTATSPFVAVSIGAIKITGDAPDDAMAIVRTYPFTAQINVAGGAALAWDNTIMSIQDSAAV